MFIFTVPSGSDRKESACNAGDAGSIPGSGRSPGERNGNHSSILAWKIPGTDEPGGVQSRGSQSQTWLSDPHTQLSSLSVCGACSSQIETSTPWTATHHPPLLVATLLLSVWVLNFMGLSLLCHHLPKNHLFESGCTWQTPLAKL